jgi:hypothetical protein
VSFHSQRYKYAYLELPDDGFVKVFDSDIDTLSNEISTVDVLFFHTPFSFLEPCHPLLLQFSGFTFHFILPSSLE